MDSRKNDVPLLRALRSSLLPCTLFVAVLRALPVNAQQLMPPTASGWSGFAPRAQSAPGRDVSQSTSGYALNIYGNGVPNVYGGWTTRIQPLQGGSYYRFVARAVPSAIMSSSRSLLPTWSRESCAYF